VIRDEVRAFIEAPRSRAAMHHALSELVKVLMQRFLGREGAFRVSVVGCVVLAACWSVVWVRRRRQRSGR